MAVETTPREGDAPRPFLTTAVTEDVLQRMERGLGARKPLLLLTGEPGTGKSALAREALRRWRQRVTPASMSARGLESGALAGVLLGAFGGKPKPGASPIALQERLIETLANATAGGRVAMLVVDDAHELPDDSVLELARLADRAAQRQCPLEVMLVGEPSLAARFEAPDLAGASDDLSVRATVAPLSAHDTRHYLLQRSRNEANAIPTQFSRKACRDIHAATNGVLRDIETLATDAARVARERGTATVSPEHVRSVWRGVRPAGASTVAPAGTHATETPAEASAPAAAAEPSAPLAAAPELKPEAHVERPAKKAARPEAAPSPPAEAPVAAVAKAEPAAGAGAQTSSDPRVKDWVSRFGGAGVSIGGQYVARSRRELEDFSDTPRPAPAARAEAAASGAPRTSGATDPASGASDDAAAWSPLKLVPGRHTGVARRRDPAFPWQMATLVLGLALIAVLIGQRRMSAPANRETVAVRVEPSAPSAPSGPSGPSGPLKSAEQAKPAASSGARATRVSRTKAVPKPAPVEPPRTPEPPPTNVASPAPAERTVPTASLAPAERTKPVTNTTTARPASRAASPASAPSPAASVTRERVAPARSDDTRYAVTAGTFTDADMARAEKKHLSRLTRYRVWVSSSKEGGVRTYRLQFGTFRSRDEAAAAAQSLLWQGVLRDAQVAELPE